MCVDRHIHVARISEFLRVLITNACYNKKKFNMIKERLLTAKFEDIRFMSDWNLHDTLSEVNNTYTYCDILVMSYQQSRSQS